MMHPQLLDGLNYESKGWKQQKDKESGTPPSSQHFGGKGACLSSEIRTRKNDKQVNYSHEPTQTKQ
jgi:hypothetical protein